MIQNNQKHRTQTQWGGREAAASATPLSSLFTIILYHLILSLISSSYALYTFLVYFPYIFLWVFLNSYRQPYVLSLVISNRRPSIRQIQPSPKLNSSFLGMPIGPLWAHKGPYGPIYGPQPGPGPNTDWAPTRPGPRVS